MKKLIFIIMCAWSCGLLAQTNELMKNLTGKPVEFKMHFDSLDAGYEIKSNFLVINDHDSINAAQYYVYAGFYPEKVNCKADLKTIDKDTFMAIYTFYEKRLFEIYIYTNSDSLSMLFTQFLKSEFSRDKFYVKDHPKHISQSGRNNILNYFLNYNMDSGKSTIFLSYQKVKKFLPLWCGTEVVWNRDKRMKKILNK